MKLVFFLIFRIEKMSKYYTPEIEEFHVGFEFEYNKGGNNWVKHTSGNHDFRDGIIDVGVGETDDALYNPFYMGISERDFRVKYLDKEDIESLDWEYFDQYRDGGTSIYRKDDKTLTYYGTNRIKEDYTLIIHNNAGSRFFYGTIKNKSELKKVLKMLGI